MAFSRFAASTSKRASSSLAKGPSSSSSGSSRTFATSTACPACFSSSSSTASTSAGLRQSLVNARAPSASRSLSSLAIGSSSTATRPPAATQRSYATATRPNAMAEVVNSPEAVAPRQSPKLAFDEVRPYNPETVVVSPIKEGAVDEAVKALREDIGRPIYLDMQATTPVDPRVLDSMLPFLTNQYGNPHSRTHAYGWETEKAVEAARKQVADLIGAGQKDIIWTSGATESNNMAIKGIARFHGRQGKKHIITLQTEHKCVLDSCRYLQDEGHEVTYLPVQKDGKVDLKELEAAIRPETILVSVMMVNNEIGTIQPIKEIGAIVKKHKGCYFHTDAAQAVGKVPINVDEMNIDLLSVSGHKLYGPKGVGAIYVRRRPRVRLEPLINGGGQERGLRSGTVPASLVVGLGEAARIAKDEMAYDSQHIKRLSDRLIKGVTDQCEAIERNGDPAGYPGCVNLSFSFIEGESFLMAMKDIALSSGSACTSASLEPSYVLRALGAEEDMAHSSIRFGIGRFTTEGEIDFVTQRIVSIVERLRDLSPLWEMHQEGIDISSINWAQH